MEIEIKANNEEIMIALSFVSMAEVMLRAKNIHYAIIENTDFKKDKNTWTIKTPD
jgi:hypothetical protein